MLKSLTTFAPFIGTVLAVGMVLWTAHVLLIKRNRKLGNEHLFPRQLIMLGLTLLGILVIILVMPINLSSRNQLIGLFGIVISAVIALSSTTIISNLMAGVLLRMTKPFRIGDFIRIGDHIGRVSERGLFDTEIQTEMSELISLPNIYCINTPLTTVRSTGTIISASLSLGYEMDHNRIEQLLLTAAKACGLKEPFVHILELGNYSVSYRVSGFLEETKQLISRKSNLYGLILDTLHSENIEIMSPTYMNQRQMRTGENAIPAKKFVSTSDKSKKVTVAEDMAFDKAELAEKIENEKIKLKSEIEGLENVLKETINDQKKQIQLELIEKKKKALESLEKSSKNRDS